MAKKKVFVSFDYENDKHYKFLMQAWDANPDFEFVFSDHSSGEINSNNISVVKAGLTRKINNATHTFVIVGKKANKQHKDYKLIGFKNWINFEVNKSKANNNKLLAIKLNKSYESPEELLGAGASWAMSFTQDSILAALKKL
ncbi:TIR domain-containing protein [Bacillus marasmi]|uniref:TIR domain-containing protein n=1 Tax=Bacillus marasmi TaxID=1926279 RepID=UPI0011C9A660|nr:TIR domain-containing protein [Bacillus marasmi]